MPERTGDLAKPRPPAWAASWPEETSEQAYHEAREAVLAADKWADAIDRKAVAVFSVSALTMMLAPMVQGGARLPAFQAAAWLGALVCFLVATYNFRRAYKPRSFRVGPNPGALQTPEWLALPVACYRYRMLEWLGKTFEDNRRITDEKAAALDAAVFWAALEVVLLSLARVVPQLVYVAQ